MPIRREYAVRAHVSRARARDMDAEDARGYFGDEAAGAALDGDAREAREAAETLADCDDDGDDRVVARARRAVRGVDRGAGESRVEAVVERCARAAARAREEARERETRARDADGGGRADDDETTSARAIEACAEVRAVGRDVEARVERAVRECEETVRMGATETMRARAKRCVEMVSIAREVPRASRASYASTSGAFRGHYDGRVPVDAAYPRRVVVTGLGLGTPLGAEAKVNWRRARDGVEGTRALEVGDVPANEREAFTRRTRGGGATFGEDFEDHFCVPPRLQDKSSELVEAVNDFHYAMINDHPRNEFYRECLRRAVVPGESVVLEIGTGSGLLAMLAARLGAKKVVAIEASPHMAELARRNVEANGLSATVVVVPLILPLGAAFGIDPVHLGIIFVANLELGYLTPPVGLNLFLASYRFDRPLLSIYRAAVPYLLILGVGVLLVTYVPWLSTWLVGMFGGQ